MKHLFIYLFGSILNQCFTLLFWYIVIREYSNTEISEYYLFLAIVELIGGLFMFGGDAVIIRFYSSSVDKASLASQFLFLTIITTSVLILFKFICYVFNFNYPLNFVYLVAGCLFASFTLFLSILQATLKSTHYIFLSTLKTFIFAIIPLVQFLYGHLYFSLESIYIFSLLIPVLFFFRRFNLFFKVNFDWSNFYMRQAFWYMAIFLLSIISARLAAYQLAASHDKRTIPIYLSFLAVINVFSGLASTFNRYFQVKVFYVIEQKILLNWGEIVSLILFLSFLVVLVSGLLSYYILFQYYFPLNYKHFFTDFIILLLSIPFLLLYTFINPFILHKNMPLLLFTAGCLKFIFVILFMVAFSLSISSLAYFYTFQMFLDVFILLFLYQGSLQFYKIIMKYSFLVFFANIILAVCIYFSLLLFSFITLLISLLYLYKSSRQLKSILNFRGQLSIFKKDLLD